MPDKFNIDDDMVTDKFEIALNFNNFYVNIGKKLSSDIILYINWFMDLCADLTVLLIVL